MLPNCLPSGRGLSGRPLLVRQTLSVAKELPTKTRSSQQIGAFRVDSEIDQPVVLIDDIYTTGATIAAGVSALREIVIGDLRGGCRTAAVYEVEQSHS